MSASGARGVRPDVADGAVGEAAVVEVAIGDVTEEKEATERPTGEAVEPEKKPVEVAQPVGGLPLVEEDAAERHKALTVARIRMSSAPAAVKERFAAVAEEAKDAAAVEACLKAVEEALPEFLQGNRGEAARSAHPAGEVFFRGNAEEITDEQAEELARRQLERSGLLRGQRVKVAD